MALQVMDAMGNGMNRKLYLGAFIALLTVPALAQDQIGTVERGQYVCELPGDAMNGVAIEQPDENFEIASASRYRSPQGNGTYLRRGDMVTMSSGPRNGQQYVVISPVMLRKIENGEPGRLRCYRRGR
jgi:hypothetical protein